MEALLIRYISEGLIRVVLGDDPRAAGPGLTAQIKKEEFQIRKKALSLTMAVLMMCAVVTTAMAQTIVPLWDNTSRCEPALYFSGTTANCSAKITGHPGTTKINAQLILQEQQSNGSYVTVKFWPLQTTSGTVLNLSGSQPGCTSGVYYRTGVIANVFNSAGVSESITVYSDPVRCP